MDIKEKMMKVIVKVLMIVGVSVVGMGFVQVEIKLVVVDDVVISEICVVVVLGKKLKLYKIIKDFGLMCNYVVCNVECNGMLIVEFVE